MFVACVQPYCIRNRGPTRRITCFGHVFWNLAKRNGQPFPSGFQTAPPSRWAQPSVLTCSADRDGSTVFLLLFQSATGRRRKTA